MVLLDHRNWRAKLIILISMLCFILMSVLANQSNENTAVLTHQQVSSPRSMAYFNPETGTFTTKPTHQVPPEAQTIPSIQARSAMLQGTQSQATEDPGAAMPPQTFEKYKESFVIPAPRSLHSTLVGHRPSQAEIENGANSIVLKHEEYNIPQPKKPGL